MIFYEGGIIENHEFGTIRCLKYTPFVLVMLHAMRESCGHPQALTAGRGTFNLPQSEGDVNDDHVHEQVITRRALENSGDSSHGRP